MNTNNSQSIANPGIVICNGEGDFFGRTLSVSNGLSIENSDGIKGDLTLSGINATTSTKGVVTLADAAAVLQGSKEAVVTPNSMNYHPGIVQAWMVIKISEKIEVMGSYNCELDEKKKKAFSSDK